jgi:hypothetical protein
MMAGPLTARDRLDIMELYARHAWAMDGGDTEAFLDVFTPDAEAYNHKGHAGIREYHRGFLQDSGFPGSQHFALNWVFVEGDTSWHRVRAYVMRFNRVPGTVTCQVVWLGYYNDLVVKQGDRWKFKIKSAEPSEALHAQRFDGTRSGRGHRVLLSDLFDIGAIDRPPGHLRPNPADAAIPSDGRG